MGNEIRTIRPDDFALCRTPEERIKFLLGYGILAPSTHNSQPWLFKIKGSTLEIYNDTRVKITEADPSSRDLYISFGCLIENIVIAARSFGLEPRVKISTHNSANLIASMDFADRPTGPAQSEVALRDEIPRRVNVRGLFKLKHVPPETRAALDAGHHLFYKLDLIEDRNKIQEIAKLTQTGLETAYRSPEFRKEMSNWMTSNYSARKDGLPGYALRLPSLVSLIFPWLVRNFNIGKRVGQLNFLSMASAPLLAIWCSDRNDHETWIEIGRSAERVMLQSRTLGLRTSIFVASVEVGELYRKVQKVIDCPSRPQFILCIGYMDSQQPPTPRFSVEEKIIL